uniref:Corin, serine peptidase n=1 Tax=Oncorhynchus kisutch TaxID=8019 RepID=A0A8C7JKL8_ONCKI
LSNQILKWALTVAHCFEGGVESIIVHPRYNRAVVDYDISVVELDREVEVTSYVRPVCLPGNGQLPQPDTYCYITGWGHMGNRSEFDTYGQSQVTEKQSHFSSQRVESQKSEIEIE